MASDSISGGAISTRADVAIPTVITTPEDFKQSLNGWQQQHYHVLTPIADFRALPSQYGLMPAQVRIDLSESAGEAYQDKLFCKDHEFALTKLGLSKIAAAAGMSIKTERTDPRTIQNYWEVKATARYIGIDGTPQELDATEELDLRDDSDRAAKVMGAQRSANALRAVRAKGMRNCEARAINAVVRQFGIKQKYTRQELEKPFVILRVVFQPNMSDPAQRQYVLERAMAGTTSLYPSRQAAAALPPPPEHLDTIGEEPTVPQVVGRGTTQPPAAQLQTPKLPEGAVLIMRVAPREIPKRDKTTFTKWFVTDSNGVELVTTKPELAKQCEDLARTKTPVTISYEENDYGDSVITKLQPHDDGGY